MMNSLTVVLLGEVSYTEAVADGYTVLQVVAAELLEVQHEEDVCRLQHVLDVVFTQRDVARVDVVEDLVEDDTVEMADVES